MIHLAWLIPLLLTSGSLGAPYLRDEVPFDRVERSHFDAIAVRREWGNDLHADPLVVRVHLVGDASEADIGLGLRWLRDHANVVVVRDPAGAPLFLTHGDLAATSGRATLGATVRSGMAVELTHPGLGACVVAHEMLHFLGLRHVDDPGNVMFPHCSKKHLERAALEPWQRARIDALDLIQATTPRGVETWASR